MTFTFTHAPNLTLTLEDLDPDTFYRDPRPFLRQNQVLTALRKKTPPPVPSTAYVTRCYPVNRSSWDPHFAYNGKRKGDKELLASLLEERAGFYHVTVELGSGGSHRYAIGAQSSEDAVQHVENYLIPEDYPGEAYLISARFARPMEVAVAV